MSPGRTAYLLVGLGGLEPPTSPLSGAFYGAICIVLCRSWTEIDAGLRSSLVSVCEAEERFLFAVVPYPCCGGAIRFLKHQA